MENLDVTIWRQLVVFYEGSIGGIEVDYISNDFRVLGSKLENGVVGRHKIVCNDDVVRCIAVLGPAMLVTITPLRRKFLYDDLAPLPLDGYPIPKGPRKKVTGYDD
ncbi:hypothetical protein KL909_000881 [Ogataea angusta]|uniref:Uncharacterized protein n=1 Tax=Pichia angusta TaxID=870730 RepID=A0AAN6DK90_PICAN|nr:uncharacterized protein KL928_000550 [Ogataea angusta]KAG7822075.1 hypothetical protein KL928_000550 [Ogataea angusta]KAG7825649.1 hypothetical protein KL909_000881 [Ogataea angusta]KAG7853499.1 hypothetical protein KL941_000549 [Ogataea angusta]KAG7862921.1 hypothetical protein KL939_000240 [Ogataea angusta]